MPRLSPENRVRKLHKIQFFIWHGRAKCCFCPRKIAGGALPRLIHMRKHARDGLAVERRYRWNDCFRNRYAYGFYHPETGKMLTCIYFGHQTEGAAQDRHFTKVCQIIKLTNGV